MKYGFKLGLNLNLITRIFKIGLPLIIIQIGAILFISIDRWMIAGMIDQINLGYYGIGLTMANFLFAGASAVAFTLYPFMLERFGQTNDVQQRSPGRRKSVPENKGEHANAAPHGGGYVVFRQGLSHRGVHGSGHVRPEFGRENKHRPEHNPDVIANMFGRGGV